MERAERQLRGIPGQFTTRAEDDGRMIIEGYFAVFDSVYQIWSDMSESINRGAFTNTIAKDDIRALINHDTTLVLGRNTAGTLELREDERGLWGRIEINPNDSDAVNAYARVSRGDVSQCSIGFDIIRETSEVRTDGSVHWTIEEARLWEVSICTFPAYEETNVTARAKERDDLITRQREAWKARMLSKLKGENHGT